MWLVPLRNCLFHSGAFECKQVLAAAPWAVGISLSQPECDHQSTQARLFPPSVMAKNATYPHHSTYINDNNPDSQGPANHGGIDMFGLKIPPWGTSRWGDRREPHSVSAWYPTRLSHGWGGGSLRVDTEGIFSWVFFFF